MLMKLVKSKSVGGIVHQRQPRLVPDVIARFGMRWWNAKVNDHAASIMRCRSQYLWQQRALGK
jgi:hypothetical protein